MDGLLVKGNMGMVFSTHVMLQGRITIKTIRCHKEGFYSRKLQVIGKEEELKGKVKIDIFDHPIKTQTNVGVDICMHVQRK